MQKSGRGSQHVLVQDPQNPPSYLKANEELSKNSFKNTKHHVFAKNTFWSQTRWETVPKNIMWCLLWYSTTTPSTSWQESQVRTEPDVTHFAESLWYILYDRYAFERISGFQKTLTAAFYPGDWRTSCWHWCSSELALSNDMLCLYVMQQPEESNQQVWATAHITISSVTYGLERFCDFYASENKKNTFTWAQ